MCVMRIKLPSSLPPFPYSTERTETQRICLHSRNARRSGEDGGSAQSWRRSHQNRVWGWTFPFASASVSGAEPGPPVPWKSWTRLPRGGRAASPDGQTHGQTGSPGGPPEGGAAGAGLRAAAPALALAWPGCGCGGGSGPWLGAGQDSHPGGGARGGGARRGFHPRMRIRTFAFPSPPS